ncbi:MAG: Wzz/FepE/Etk N-terminal domain-containing protein [Smithellaceae bacterium]|nr:Wzz/FepE/Etk N-terminal domain-containing protein [Smithellaceae bacterium]
MPDDAQNPPVRPAIPAESPPGAPVGKRLDQQPKLDGRNPPGASVEEPHLTAPGGCSPGAAADPRLASPGSRNPYPPGMAEEDEINLLDLFIVLLKHKVMILSVVFLAGVAAVVYSLQMKNIYRSECTIATTAQGRAPGGALAALGDLGGMIAPDMFQAAGSLEQFDVVLKSRELTNIIVMKYNLLPLLFEGSWDAEKKRWKAGVKKPPTWQDAYKVMQGMLKSVPDRKKNVLSLSFEFKDPKMAQTILNYYVEGLSEYLRQSVLTDSAAQLKGLYEQLAKTTDPLLKNRIYGMIAGQIEKETVAMVQRYYSFNVIDPAFVPERKFAPKRAQICMIAVVVAFFIAIFLAFFLEYVKNLKTREDPERLANLRNALRLRRRS